MHFYASYVYFVILCNIRYYETYICVCNINICCPLLFCRAKFLSEGFCGFSNIQVHFHCARIGQAKRQNPMSGDAGFYAGNQGFLFAFDRLFNSWERTVSMKEYKPFKSGKVREVYDIGDSLIMVATDRISAFDHILKNRITDKGAILTQMSSFWFEYTKDVIRNHMITTDNERMPEFFRQEQFTGNSMKVQKLTMLPLECIVRGYITGSGWASYQKTGTVCGIRLPEGLVESQKLPEPIYTPSTKADLGDHDENISYEQSIDVLEKKFPGHGKEYATALRDKTIELYTKCADYARSRGIIIADTKFEFGLDENGEIVLGDEMLTPDSSRFWPADGYQAGHSQPSYDKQFVRDWLKANPDSDYKLPQDVIDRTIEKYKEAYLLLTGKEFTRTGK